MKIGAFLVSIGMLAEEQVEAVLNVQRAGDTRRFGDIALEFGFLKDDAIKRFADFAATTQDRVPL